MAQPNYQLIRSAAVNKGLILGLIIAVLGIASFYILTSLEMSVILMSAIPFMFSIVIPIILAAIFSANLRRMVGGYWSFKEAVAGIFLMFFVAFAVSFVLKDLVFAKFIEPNMIDKVEQKITDKTALYLAQNNLSQEKIDKQIDDMHKSFAMQKNTTVLQYITSIGVSALLLFVLALIFAAIYKKERPLYLQESLDE